MTLSDEQIRVIKEYPLQDLLSGFPTKLRDLQASEESWRADVASLLGALLTCQTAVNLPTLSGDGTVAGKLFTIVLDIQKGGLELAYFRPLVNAILANASDIDIWAAVLNLVTAVNPLNPQPFNLAATFNGTPLRSSSSRLADSETRDIVEKELFYEIKDCTFRNVGGFCDKFFNRESWGKEQKDAVERLKEKHDGKEWIGFPPSTDEEPVWAWLCSLEKYALTKAQYKLYTTQTANQFKERKGQMDLFFQRSIQIPDVRSSGMFEYKHVLVVGEQKKSYDSSRFKSDFLQLTRYVRSIFADQPTRRFVHGFTLCGYMMELWVFDRSGAYSSGPFNIHKEEDMFACAIVGYATMDNDAMGLDTFIERQAIHRYITLNDISGKEVKIRLGRPITRQKAIVCRGTTCFETEDNHVAKFSWIPDKLTLEAEQLKLVEKRGVQGVARLVAHHQITTIAKLREGLKFKDRHRFRNEHAHFGHSLSVIASAKLFGNKRKSLSDHASDNTPSPKRQRSSSQKPKLSVGNARTSSYTSGDDSWENRILCCLIISPAGRVISDFETVGELLEAMRDAIKAHQSLYEVGNILHRDISSNNIIITKPTVADGFKGMLIDLDLAKARDSGPSGARHITGTMQFIAVEVLRMADHTYRHDLESFFYVLLWLCAHQSWGKERFAGDRTPTMDSLLRKWLIGTMSDIADAKEGHTTVNGLERIMGEFPDTLSVLKPLCLRIRSILFGDTATLTYGTPAGDPNQLYGPIIAAYNDAINDLKL